MAKQVRGHRWTNIQELSGALGRWAKVTPKNWFSQFIRQLEERWARCVQMHGAYVEAAENDSDSD